MKNINKWKIGNIEIKNQVVLAPMAGISDVSYLKICEEIGVGYAITELISAEAIVRNNKKTFDMLKGIDKLKMPVAIQLFGSNPDTLAKAAKIIVDLYNVPIIDLNFGCPVPKVALRAEAGSALLKSPKKIGEIVKKVSESILVPVTVKIRSGWDNSSINAVEVAKIAEKNGAKAITIHARTRSEGYSGKANWDIIKEVKENVSIPVIGNGDITSPKKALEMLKETNCDAIMIGRASLGNPWIFKETLAYLEEDIILPKPTNCEKIEMLEKHYQLLKTEKGVKVALLEIRTHALAYLKGIPQSKEYKEKICKMKTEEEFLNILVEYKNIIRNENIDNSGSF